MDGEADDPDEFFDYYLAYADPDRPAAARKGPAARWQTWWGHRHLDLAASAAGRLARKQGFVLTTTQAYGLGLGPPDLRREVRRLLWTAPAHGVIAPLAVAGSVHRRERRLHALAAAGAALKRPGQAISVRSAAVVHGLPTLAVPPLADLTAPESASLGRRRAAHVRGAALPDAHRTTWFGAPVTTIARTIADVARHDRRDGLMVLDAALHEGLVTFDEVARVLDVAAGWPGVDQAREILFLGSAKAESPLESVTRLALHDSGFPRPELQVVVGPFRVDFMWPAQRVILEADGREKLATEARWHEKKRELKVRRLSRCTVLRVTWSDVLYDWPETSAQLAEELGFPSDFVKTGSGRDYLRREDDAN